MYEPLALAPQLSSMCAALSTTKSAARKCCAGSILSDGFHPGAESSVINVTRPIITGIPARVRRSVTPK